MTLVVCFEGPFPTDAYVAWGAAGIDVGGRLLNSVTRQSMPLLESWKQSGIGNLTELPQPIEISEDYQASQLLVVAISRRLGLSHVFEPDAGQRIGHYYDRRTRTSFSVFRDRTSFEQYSSGVATDITGYMLRNTPPENLGNPAVTAALTLCPHHLFLHAIRIGLYGTDGSPAFLAAERLLRSDNERRQFRELVALMKTKELDHAESVRWLKYKDGIAEGGGLDVTDAVRTFGALRDVFEKLKGEVAKVCQFVTSLGEIPPFRVAEMITGSANIGISVDIPGKTVFDRILRYYSVEALRDVLEGKGGSELTDDADFQEALDTLVNPSPETVLLQQGRGDPEPQPVVFKRPAAAEMRAERSFRMLAVVQGAYDDVRKIELRLFPNVRETVPREDDGRGGQPIGVDAFIKTSTFLFRICIARLVRHTDGGSKHRFYLQELELLSPGSTGSVLNLPSSVVPGSFVVAKDQLVVSVSIDGIVSLSGKAIAAVDATSIGSANRLLERYQTVAAEVELELARQENAAEWIRPLRRRAPPPLTRLLIVTMRFGGHARLTDVLEEITRVFGIAMSRGNARRDIIAHDRLIQFVPDADDTITLTEEGRLNASIILHAQIIAE